MADFHAITPARLPSDPGLDDSPFCSHSPNAAGMAHRPRPKGIQEVLLRASSSTPALQTMRQKFLNSAPFVQLDLEIHHLRQQLGQRVGERTGEALRLSRDDFDQTILSLRRKEELAFLLSRVPHEAQRKLLCDEQFLQQFLGAGAFQAFVLSIDIRRSTELMLKARSAELFAQFLSGLCEEIEAVTRENLGIFDKFTGDGTLAFFPEFFSGADAGYRVLQTARQCHEVFRGRYKAHRSSFTSVLNHIGLGIGIDYGNVHLVRMSHGLTVVGGAVVYACRLGGAPPYRTYVNQPAFEVIQDRYGEHIQATEMGLDIKHEGQIVCNDVELIGDSYRPEPPSWIGS